MCEKRLNLLLSTAVTMIASAVAAAIAVAVATKTRSSGDGEQEAAHVELLPHVPQHHLLLLWPFTQDLRITVIRNGIKHR